MRSLTRIIDRTVRHLGAATTLGFAAIVFYAVVARYLFGRTPSWAEELPRLMLVWLCFIGSISCFARDSHFRAGFLDLLVRHYRARQVLGWLATLATLIFLGLLVETGWRLTDLTWANQTTALRMPVGLFYLCLPVCGVISIVVVLTGRGGE